MMAIAFYRTMSEDFVGWTESRGELGASNRRWQDKARKVRAVGWGRVERRNPVIPQTL